MSKGLSAEETTITAWQMAVWNRAATQKLIFHSDRGIQYACSAFSNVLNANKEVYRSMSRIGIYWDNTVVVSFFKTINVEFVNKNQFSSQDQAKL